MKNGKSCILSVVFVLVVSVSLFGQMPAPTGLTAVQSGEDAILLNWNEPVLPFDGFEGFESGIFPADFSIFNINSDNTWGILNQGYNSSYSAACLYDTHNDDWLVSPELDVTATSEFNFMAGNYDATYSQEEFEVYISTTGPDPSNFPATPELYFQFDDGTVYWEAFNIDLSSYAGQTIWLAIRCISPYMYYLLIDDYSVTNLADGSDFVLSFDDQESQTIMHNMIKQGETKSEFENRISPIAVSNPFIINSTRDFLGYNVYRDNVQVNTGIVTELSYLDTGLSLGIYEYYVTAVYDEDESDPTETVSIELLPIGDCDEGFESGDFLQFPWVMQGQLPWTISTDLPFNGTYCAKSGAISDNEESILFITLNITTAGDLSFARKISSEADYDFLEFYIDDVMIDSWSGITEWSFPGTNVYAVDAGTHIFKWRFMKDAGTPGGDDCAWLDNITFPLHDGFGGLDGYVYDDQNVPLENVFVSLDNGLISAYTSDTGFYSFPILNSGNHDISATIANYYDFVGSVSINVGQTTTFDIVLTPYDSSSLSGVVTDSFTTLGISGAIVGLNNDPDLTVQTDDNGNYIITDINTGFDYQLTVYAPGYSGNSQTIYINTGANTLDIELNELLYPPSNITAEWDNDDTIVNWEEPASSPPDYFRYDNGLSWWGVGTFNATTIPNHAFGNTYYNHAIINNVEFCVFDYSNSGPYTNSVKVIILGLGEDGYPNGYDILYDSGWIDHVEGHENWNIHELEEPVEALNGFFVGIRANPDTYPEFFMCTTDPTPPSSITWPATYGNSWMCADILEEYPTWTPPETSDFLNGGYLPTNFQVRANGFSIEELDNRPIQTLICTNNFEMPLETERFEMNRDVISNFGNSYPRSGRSVESYGVWRLLTDDINDPTQWDLVSEGIIGLTCTDTGIINQNAGVYCYAVQTEYSGNLLSSSHHSNNVANNMHAELSIIVNTPSGDNTENARIRIFGDDPYAPGFGEELYEFYIGPNNTATINAFKQTYVIYVDLEGYEQYILEDVYHYDETEITIELVDLLVAPYGVNVDVLDDHVDVNWLPAVETVLLNHKGPETTPIYLNDYPAEDTWWEYDREGAFDIVITEAVLITKLVIESPIYFTPTQNCFGEFYDTPLVYTVKLYEDTGNGMPQQVHVDSTQTIPVMQNEFQEYSAVLEDPFALTEGTFWISVAAYLPHDPAFPSQPGGSPWGADIDFQRTTDLHNSTAMTWRMPYYNGPEWTMLDSDLEAYVVGRLLEPSERSVESYDVYRLLTDDIQNPEEWVEIVLNIPETYTMDDNIPEADIYRYAVIANFPNNQSEAAISPEYYIEPFSSAGIELPLVTALYGNYPNPFNPETTIKFSIKEESDVKMSIFNMKGQKVKTVKLEMLPVGQHSIVWQGKDNSGKSVASGVYFYKMETKNYKSTKKMILLK